KYDESVLILFDVEDCMSSSNWFAIATRISGQQRVRLAWTRISLVLLCSFGAARWASAANGTWGSSAPFSGWAFPNDWVSGIVPGTTTAGSTTNTDTATFNSTS